MEVFARDEFLCLARKFEPGRHVCRNVWGEVVEPGSIEYVQALTLEHVRLEPGGKRRDRKEFCVTLCHHANTVLHWGSGWENRHLLNAHLDELYPHRRTEFS